ncbi:amidohydrolase family protein [Clostridium ljungdahlii]|uniref:Amidohydrolase n=1 Tax=Clostridium ljungdahlii TaxID=1538 RepID=A0A168LEJ8_9CLOT|nr:amidohydrolase family protein [Clostridium ljungdahlii]OAA83053.1 Amidohydrolase [Clostridium ljungdahlii]
MEIIDSHLHFSNINSFKEAALNLSKVNYSSTGLKEEFEKNHIIMGIGMGLTEKQIGGFPDSNSHNPMDLDLEEKVPDNLVYCLGINPQKLNDEELSRIEERIKNSKVVGLKIYPGYYPYYVWNKIYDPIYKLASSYKIPVVIHGGDPYSSKALVKYSHPIHIDELAVKHRNINFVIAHFGNPWIMSAAEVIYKNSNVYTDLSGLLVGNKNDIDGFKNDKYFIQHIQRGITFIKVIPNWYEKFLFGTDWPLVPIKSYIELIKSLFDEKFYEYIFYKNALKVFPKLNTFFK